MTRSTNLNYDQAFEEVIAQSCESFLRDIHLSDKAEQLYKTDKGLATKIKNILNRILNAVKKWYGVAKPQSIEANYVSEMKDALSEAYDKYIAGIRAASENLRNMEKSTEGAPKNMLRDIPSAFDQNIKSVAIMDPVVSLTGNEFAKSNVDLITQVTDYFNSVGGVAHSQYGDVRLTRSGVKASIGHGIGRNKAIAFKAVQNVLQDGLMIDYQKNWKQRGYNTAVIAAPITIGQNDYYMAAIVIEQSGTNDYYLHEVLLKEKENATAFKTGTAKSGTPSAETSSIYSILRDLQNINTSTQKNQSRSDADYLSAVKRGDMKTAQRMVDEAVKAAGYSAESLWRMDHKAPDSRYNVRLDQIDRAYNNDGSIYSRNAAYYYGDGRDYDNKAIEAIRKARNNPDVLVSVYRAVPTQIKDKRIRNGDWVTIDGEYAEEHGWRMFDDAYRVIENKVPARYLFTDGSSIHEFGYDNGNTDEVYKNTKNNVKLATVTYDDNGDVIPLSERFNESNKDIRYQSRDDDLFSIDLSDDDTNTGVAARRKCAPSIMTAKTIDNSMFFRYNNG